MHNPALPSIVRPDHRFGLQSTDAPRLLRRNLRPHPPRSSRRRHRRRPEPRARHRPLRPHGPPAAEARTLHRSVPPSPGHDGLGCAAASQDGGPALLASDLDAPRPDGSPNYTADVLTRLTAQFPGNVLFAIVGVDSFLTLPRWRDPARLFELAQWIIVSRPGYTLDRSALAAFTPEQQGRLHHIPTVNEDVSATELRHRLQHGDPCLDLIPDLVAAYIVQHGLYRQGSLAGPAQA